MHAGTPPCSPHRATHEPSDEERSADTNKHFPSSHDALGTGVHPSGQGEHWLVQLVLGAAAAPSGQSAGVDAARCRDRLSSSAVHARDYIIIMFIYAAQVYST